jgi:uncharacterized membrane protein SpoIIM required for sporulation
MKIHEFVRRRHGAWEEFRRLSVQASGAGLKKMPPADLDRLIWLYREITNDLAAARARWPDSDTARDLNDLVLRGHSVLYHHRAPGAVRAGRFLTRTFPRAVRRQRPFVLTAVFVLLFFTVIGSFAHRIDERLPAAVVPRQFLDHFRTELKERNRVDRDIAVDDRSIFSSQLITHNIQVSFGAFALGVVWGIGTLYILAVNGLMMGCIGALFAQHGQLLNYLAFILPHGVVEISAIALAGAAGLRVGYGMLNPGELTFAESVIHAAGEAMELIMGAAAMLFIAGLLEAFFTPVLWIPDGVKVIFAMVLFALLIVFFVVMGKSESGQDPNGVKLKISVNASDPYTP